MPQEVEKNDFNSIKVQLERIVAGDVIGSYANFNSIKVQLERSIEQAYVKTAKFQFHKGTIRTGNLLSLLSCCRLISIP